jgi:hypothetical protein
MVLGVRPMKSSRCALPLWPLRAKQAAAIQPGAKKPEIAIIGCGVKTSIDCAKDALGTLLAMRKPMHSMLPVLTSSANLNSGAEPPRWNRMPELTISGGEPQLG